MKNRESGPGVVIEITTFRLREAVNTETFAMLDRGVENVYTRHQPGFVSRDSGVSEDGKWLVVVYWLTMADADASMQKFMGDASVADYAGMIDSATMRMRRYQSSPVA